MGSAPVDRTGEGGSGSGPHAPASRAGAAGGVPGWLVPTRPVPAALALAALAVAVRLVAWARTEAIMNDGPAFLRLAWTWANGQWAEALGHPYHPLYPLAVAAVRPLFGDAPPGVWEPPVWEAAGAAVSIASGGLAAVFLYDFLRRAFGGWVPVVGTVLYAVHPYAVPYTADVQTEGLYFALFLAAVDVAWRAVETPRFGLAAAAGATSGLAYLTRPEGIGVVLAAGGVMALLALRGLRTPRQLAGFAAGVALGAGLTMTPYLVAVQRTSGDLQLTQKKSLVDIATLDEDAVELRERERGEAPRAREPAWRKWGRRAAHGTSEVVGAARHTFRLDHWIVGALGVWAVGGPPGLRALFLAALVGLYGAVLFGLQLTAGYVSMRHALPPLLPLLGYVALGVPTVGRVVLTPARLLRRGPPAPRTALLVGLALLATASTVMATRPQREDRAASRAAAEWLAERGGAEQVAATKQRDAYYAETRYARMPRAREGADWVASVRQRGVRYIILDERAAREYPGLGEEGLTALDPRLRVLHRTEAHGRWAVVLEIADAAPATE
jgi:hypothetical protein